MEIEKFIENYREAFGEAAGLPVVFWYSDEETGHTEKIGGCFFKGMQEVRAGNTISLNAEVIGCGGGKFYTGFADARTCSGFCVVKGEIQENSRNGKGICR